MNCVPIIPPLAPGRSCRDTGTVQSVLDMGGHCRRELASSMLDICTVKYFTPGRELRQCGFWEAPSFQLHFELQLSEVSVFGFVVFIHTFCIFYYDPLIQE